MFPEEERAGKSHPESPNGPPSPPRIRCVDLHIVLFPHDAAPLAKQFWQHTGLGISSRLAERCLSMLSAAADGPQHHPMPSPLPKSVNRHYRSSFGITKCDLQLLSPPPSPVGPKSPQLASSDSGPKATTTTTTPPDGESLGRDQIAYVEERYGRNLPLDLASNAKKTLRRRIAGVLGVHDDGPTLCVSAGAQMQVGPSSRGVTAVTEDDVYLYPSGMAAIWSAHQLVLNVRPPAKSVCFGSVFFLLFFPYSMFGDNGF